MTDAPTPYECEVLRHVAGEPQRTYTLLWGAALSETIEELYGAGYVTRLWTDGAYRYVITDKGRETLRRCV